MLKFRNIKKKFKKKSEGTILALQKEFKICFFLFFYDLDRKLKIFFINEQKFLHEGDMNRTVRHEPDKVRHELDKVRHELDEVRHEPDEVRHEPDEVRHKPDEVGPR